MRRTAAAAGTAIFLVIAPGATAVLIPWLLTGWHAHVPPPPGALRLAGLVLVVMGAAVLLSAFARFVLEGRGTPAPVAPTQHLVVGGLYRYVRNPMYLAVAATIVGQTLLLGRLELLAYAALFLVTTAAFARLYEEPALQRQYGREYERYRRAVPGWWPRLHPWRSSEEAEALRHRSEPGWSSSGIAESIAHRPTGDWREWQAAGRAVRLRAAMRRVVIALGLIVGIFFIVRAVVEVLTIDYSDPSSYADDWGGPSLAGVLLVHCALGLIAAIWIGVYTWRRRSSHSRSPWR